MIAQFSSVASDPGTQTVVISRGSSVSQIARQLRSENLIRQAWAFQLAVRAQGLSDQLQAGSFQLSPASSTWELAQQLTEGRSEDVWITILEGWRREEVAAAVADQLPGVTEEQFLAASVGQEGFLFPDTYLIPLQADAQQVADLLTTTFDQKVADRLPQGLAYQDYSPRELVTLASIVERESRGLDEMKTVAGILYNRLEIGMPLQVDATLQYSKDYDQQLQTWWAPPLAVDKELDSPYNTYLKPGIPPGPIANPSLDALEAVVDPTPSDFFFYIHDRTGQIHYGRDLAEHNRNIDRYLR